MSEEQMKNSSDEDSNIGSSAGIVIGSLVALVIYGLFGTGIVNSTNLILNIVFIFVGIALIVMLLMGVYGLIFKPQNSIKKINMEDIEGAYTELNMNYKILRNQVQAGFVFSIVALLIGLLIISYSVIMTFGGYKIDNLYIISGIIIEFISGTFFIVYKINFNRLNTISDELFKMWKIIISLKEIKNLEGNNKIEMTKVLIEKMIQ